MNLYLKASASLLTVPVALLVSAWRGPSPPAPSPTQRLLSAEKPDGLAQFDARGRRISWEAQAATFRGLAVEGLTTEKKAGRTLWRRTGAGPCRVALPVWGPSPVRGDDVVAVRVETRFAMTQARPPEAHIGLRIVGDDGAEQRAEWPTARATRDGDTWWLELERPGGSGLRGTVSELRLELRAFAGDSFEVRRVEILTRDEAAGPLALTEGGETRRVYATPAGTAFETRVLPDRDGRLVGELARHPAARGTPGPVTAELTVSAAGRELRRRFLLPADGPTWVRYELPVQDQGGPVTIRLAAGAAGGVVWTPPALVATEAGAGRGVVLISIDTLRADAVFPRDDGPSLLPRLAARARRQGQVVRHHYAAANWTLPAHASLLTGRYPTSHGATDGDAVVDLSAGSLPAALGAHGFYTAGIVDGGYVGASYGFGQSFDTYREAPAGARRLGWHGQAYRALLPQLRSGDFFLFLHSYFVHDYYQFDGDEGRALPERLAVFARRHATSLLSIAQTREADTPLDPRFVPLMRALYAQRAEAFDRWLDGFLDELERDFATPPLVVVTADHGECLGDDPGHLYWHHGTTSRDEELRVPLVVFHRDRRPRPEVLGLTSQVDVTPTILRLVDIAPPAGAYEGVDLLDPAALGARLEVYSSGGTDGRHTWAAIGRGVKMVEEPPPGAARDAGPVRMLRHGEPGAFERAPAETPETAEGRAIERRRRDALYAGDDGLYVQADNPTGTEQDVVIELTPRSPARSAGLLDVSAPVQLHLLEGSDVASAAPGHSLRYSLTLPPGDTDLIVVKGASDLDLTAHSASGPVAVQIGGEIAAGPGPFVVGRQRSLVADHPPSYVREPRTAVVRVWENRPPGSPRHVPRLQPISGHTYERLRALGYVN